MNQEQTQYNSGISAQELARQRAQRLKLQEMRVMQQRDQEMQKQAYTKQMAQGVQASHHDMPKSEAQKKQEIKHIQRQISKKIQNQELQNIADDVTDVFLSSKMAMPVQVAKIAIDSRAALKDYHSKWWLVATVLAIVKDTIGDLSVFFGLMLSLYFLIFLMGGGFVKKYLKKKILILVILMIISFIPIVNIIVPETLIAVFVRWDGSRKAAEKGKNNLKIIGENIE